MTTEKFRDARIWLLCVSARSRPLITWCFLAHSLATLGRWGCGEHYHRSRTARESGL
ncbi:hypothetical protein GVD85_23720 [Escherichia coli]|nr:hypothetical protein [Escherichia coli]